MVAGSRGTDRSGKKVVVLGEPPFWPSGVGRALLPWLRHNGSGSAAEDVQGAPAIRGGFGAQVGAALMVL
jgi:uncharacterized membrane protein